MCIYHWIAIGGCSGRSRLRPFDTPMPPRLDKEAQATVDEAWEKALKPVDHLDHQVLLDALIGMGADPGGIDKLYLRSEKLLLQRPRGHGNLFRPRAPTADRFEVEVISKQDKVLRHEHYSRDEVEKTYREVIRPTPTTGQG